MKYYNFEIVDNFPKYNSKRFIKQLLIMRLKGHWGE